MVWLIYLIFATIPTLAKIVKEHAKVNLVEMEGIKKLLDEKKVALIKWVVDVKWWIKKEADAQAQLRVSHELLL